MPGRQAALEPKPMFAAAGSGRFTLKERGVSVAIDRKGIALSLAGPASRWGVRWSLADASDSAPRGEAAGSLRVNSFVGPESEWRVNQPTCGRIVVDDIKPGLDLVVEPRPHALEYTLVVRPGVDFRAVRLRYEGAGEVRVVDAGSALEIQAGDRILREEGLLCYQDSPGGRQFVESHYAAVDGDRDGTAYAIEVGAHDPARPLVIDPTLTWSSYLGGAVGPSGGYDFGRDITSDAAGNLYVIGQTGCTDFFTPGAFSTSYGGSGDVFVAKINASASGPAWITYLGGGSSDDGFGIAVDGAGCVYVTGYTTSFPFPTTPGAMKSGMGGGQDAFVTKLSPDGASLVWSTCLGGDAGADAGASIAVDAAGYVYVCGQTFSSDFPATLGAYSRTIASAADAFIVKMKPDGSGLVWGTFLGGASGTQKAYDLAIDPSGNVYVVGTTSSASFPTPNGFSTTMGGSSAAFAAKVSSTGASLLWGTYIGGNLSDNGYTIALDADGRVIVGGYATSSAATFPLVNAVRSTMSGTEGFVMKLDDTTSPVSIVWSTFLGGGSTDVVNCVAVDAAKNVYVTGTTSSTDFPVTGGFQTTMGTADDAFVVKFNPDGTFGWGSYLGGAGLDGGAGIVVDALGFICVTGTARAGFPVPGGFDTSLGGVVDAFVARISNVPVGTDGIPPTVTITSPTSGGTTGSALLSMAGTAADNGTLAGVTWTNTTTGASGQAAGLGLWTASVPLLTGANGIVVTAFDASGNSATAAITATYDPTLVPPAGGGGGGGGHKKCGLLGLEALLLAGVLALSRRRKWGRHSPLPTPASRMNPDSLP